MQDDCTKFNYKEMLQSFDPQDQAKIRMEVERRVGQAKIAEQYNIEARRERLKLLREEENRALTLANNVETKDQDQVESMTRRILEIELVRERERQQIVERKRRQQKFLNCEPIRTVLSKQQEKAIKNDQWWQIKQRIQESDEKRKFDDCYKEIMLKNIQEAIQLEEEIRRKKLEQVHAAKVGYLVQMEEKRKMRELTLAERNNERLLMQQEQERLKEEEELALRERMQKVKQLDAEMKEMIEKERARRQQLLNDESSMANEIGLIAGSQNGLDKLSFKREMDSYMESLRSLAVQRKAEEKQFDERLAKLVEEREVAQFNEKKKIEDARAELARTVQKGRQQQILDKLNADKLAQETAAEDKKRLKSQMHGLNFELDVAKKNDMESKRRYADELLAQMTERKERQSRMKLEELREKQYLDAERVKFEEELKELAETGRQWHHHPLRGVKCAAQCDFSTASRRTCMN